MTPGYRGTFVAFVAAATLAGTSVLSADERRGRGDEGRPVPPPPDGKGDAT